MIGQHIVVGYDGSGEAHRAVDWAAAEATRSLRPLQIVHAYQIAWPGAYYDMVVAMSQDAERRAGQLVDQIVQQVRDRTCGVEVSGTAVLGPTAAALLDLADTDAGLLVVGNRGAGGVANLLLGSVSQQVATHARAPVVVVRGRPAASVGPVAVGVDGSASADRALGLAFEAATDRETELVAIRAYLPPSASVLPPSAVEASERAALQASLAGWRDMYPTVRVEALAAVGRAADVLIGASHTAQLVVVGSRGHGGFMGLLFGSVGLQLMNHAECPVLIAHGVQR